MKVVFRADANAELGTGHVMRCLCLADALRAEGAEIAFISRSLPAYLADSLRRRQYLHIPLPELNIASGWSAAGLAAESIWPDEVQQADALAVAELAGKPDWLVVDHYGLGLSWERTVSSIAGGQLMALDDLGRAHVADLLLDQNLHSAPASRYQGKVSKNTACLLGPSYALLRPEFGRLRETVSRNPEVRRVLVFMGGVDTANYTGMVLRAWELLERKGIALDVVIGQGHPAKEEIVQWCRQWPGAVCHVQTDRMGELMAQADLAVGAGGGTTWERCALGLPTLALCVADNQRAGLDACAASGWLYVADAGVSQTPESLAMSLSTMLDSAGWRASMSKSAMAGVDGLGAQRVLRAMQGAAIEMRQVVERDASDLYEWRNDERVRRMSVNSQPISREEHMAWLARVLADPDRYLLIGHLGGQPIGVVRFDVQQENALVSIYLNPAHLGSGKGLPLLKSAQAWLCEHRSEIQRFRADVLPMNRASLQLFERAGYKPELLSYSLEV